MLILRQCVIFCCEVSLGNSHVIRQREILHKPPDGFASVKCLGKSYIDPRTMPHKFDFGFL